MKYPFTRSFANHACLVFSLGTLPLLLPASTTLARGDAPAAIGHFEDWHNLDKVDIVQPFHLADYKSVVVEPVVTKGVALPDKGDNTYGPITTVLGSLTATFAAGVGEKGKLPVTQGKGGAGALVIRARVITINPGSEAARFFGGIAGKAAAAAAVGLAGEVVDGKTGKTLFRFEQTRRSGFNSRSGVQLGPVQIGGENPYVRLLNRSTKEVGNDVGGALTAF